ncbi:MAG: redoxin [Leptothrix sp. (in: Bacteria)]|nr:redoxin [Leptothrix sp. (in: b-proteobacteria)]
MKRRGLLMAGAGAAAAGAGVAWQLWRATPAGDAPLDAATLAFWQSSFPQPDGRTLALAPLRGRPLVLNFWATWCPPCVKEMPELDRFAKAFAARGGRVVGLAVDNPSAVRQFLAKTPVGYDIALAGFDGTQLSRDLGNTTGALPFTAVFDRRGAIVQRKLGETSQAELESWVRNL